MLFNNLAEILADDSTSVVREDSPSDVPDRAALALKIDRAMREKAPAGWEGDETKERVVQNFLHKLMEKDRDATLAIFDIVKNQPGY